MKPTDEQLRDPKWWDENAQECATHWIEASVAASGFVTNKDPMSGSSPALKMWPRPTHPVDATDMVNSPPHYQSDSGIECIEAIRAALGSDGFVAHCRGTAIKYAWRSGKKSAHAEDLRKAAWYLEQAARELEK